MKRALVVGINEYGNLSLKGSIVDATKFANVIAKNGDDSLNFEVLQFNDLPKAVLKKSLIDLFSDTNETALFYFSGHGYLGQSDFVYLATSDGKHYDPGILIEEVIFLANASKVKHKVIILECCHAGAIAFPKINLSTHTQISEGVELILATRESESQTDFRDGSLFTNSLILGLNGSAADSNGNIYTSTLFSHTEKSLRNLHPNPMYKSCVSEFALLRSKAFQQVVSS